MNDREPQKQLAAALGRIPSGLFVVTVRRGGAETGMLASWVQQCSFEPPQISLAIKRGREIAAWLTEDAPFVVNILDESQTDMLIHFGRGFRLDEPAFTGLAVERAASGAPVLSEALAYLDCRVVSRCAAGDHDLYIGRVIAGRMLGEGHPMVHVRKSGFHY
ncbi:MAG TPA: flavin reductase family protein [Gemmataceae bacterium]|jgi:flavin reductase (DIM6/NTAB) family NADH-FMN oxidoreductase RutF|nr:flavin reductase family protein [Gemmataceae bacterium]